MLAVELGVNQHHLSLTNDTLYLLPAPRLPLATLFDSEAGQRHIFCPFDMGHARPSESLRSQRGFLVHREGFAAIFEISFGNSSWAFDGGDQEVPSLVEWCPNLEESSVQLMQSGFGIHMILSLRMCCCLPTPG